MSEIDEEAEDKGKVARLVLREFELAMASFSIVEDII
jgi:hypothetical protein